MGQELGIALVNFGKPAEVTAVEDVGSQPSIAEGQTEFQIPTQDCEIQQGWDQDQRTGGLEEGKKETGACSEVVALQTDDSKIAKILERKENSKHNNSTKHATNSGVTGHCNHESLLHKGSGVKTDLLDVKYTSSNCKSIQSEFIDEGIYKATKQPIKNYISESNTKNEVKSKKKLQSIVIQKNEPVRKHRKEQEWNNWEGGQRKHKSRISRSSRWSSSRSSELKTANASSEYTKDARRERKDEDRDKERRTEKEFDRNCYHRKRSSHESSYSSSDTESSKNSRSLGCRRERRRKTGIRSLPTEHDFYAYENNYNNARFLRRRSTTSDSSCFTVESSECYELECESGGKHKTKYMTVESQRKRSLIADRMSSAGRKANRDHCRLDAKVKKTRKQQMMRNEGLSLASQSKSIGSKCSSDIKSSRELIGKSEKKIQKKSKNHLRNICFVKDNIDQAAYISPVGNDSIDSSKDNAGAKPNKALHDLHGKLKDAGKTKGTSGIDELHAHSKPKEIKFGGKYISWHPAQNKPTYQAAKTIENGLNGHPQVRSSVQSPDESLNNSNISCFSGEVAAWSSLKTRIVESNPNLNPMKAKKANLNASVTNAPVSDTMPPVAQEGTALPSVLKKCLSSALSPEDKNHLVERFGIQVCSGSFGTEKLADVANNRKFNEVPHQTKHTSSTSFENPTVTNRANQPPSMLDLQMQLLNLSQALSLALSPVAPLARRDPTNQQRDILRQLLNASIKIPPQRPRNPGISTWYNKPLSDWDAPSPYSDELVSFSPPLPKDIDSCKEVNKVGLRDMHTKSSNEFNQRTSVKKNSTIRKWRNSDRLKKTVEAVKEVVLPLFTKRQITKDEYKQVMRVVVPKIFHCKTEFSKESIDGHVQLCVPHVRLHEQTCECDEALPCENL